MTAHRLTRTLRRSIFSGVIWGMVPLAAFSGMPTVSCGCGGCRCGGGCSNGHSSGLTCCKAAADDVGSCCGEKHQTANGSHGNQFSNHRCNTLIAARHAIQPIVTILDDSHATAAIAVASEFAGDSPARRHPETLSTGPPIDLVVTLRHLLI